MRPALVGAVLLLTSACGLPFGRLGGDPAPSAEGSSPTAATSTVSPTPSGTPTLPPDGRPIQPIPDVKPAGFADPPPGKGMQRYAEQELEWRPCLEQLTCAKALVPLDYGKPDEAAITLVLARRAATGPRRLGTLFINPGGPGGSGIEYATYFSNRGLENYDIVGWDPRGVGASTPVECFGENDLDRYYAMDASPDDGSELTARIEAVRAFGQSCLERSGKLLEHISTVETVRDLDLLRGLVGDNKLNYYGVSYGTRIGSLYAELYGNRVGRMVLDASINIGKDDKITQIEGFERALDHYARWCAEQQCALGDTKDTVKDAIKEFLDQLDQKPLDRGGRTLTQQMGVESVLHPTYYGVEGWGPLTEGLVAAIQDQDPRRLLELSDLSNRRRVDGSYGQLNYSFPAVRCLDSQDDSVREAQQRYRKASDAAPVLGRVNGPDLVCPLWPVASAPPQPTIDGKGAPPIVVIGTTGDPATPYEYAVSMAEQLESGVLVTFNGEGHGAYGQSECVQRLVVAYLVDHRVPPDRSRC